MIIEATLLFVVHESDDCLAEEWCDFEEMWWCHQCYMTREIPLQIVGGTMDMRWDDLIEKWLTNYEDGPLVPYISVDLPLAHHEHNGPNPYFSIGSPSPHVVSKFKEQYDKEYVQIVLEEKKSTSLKRKLEDIDQHTRWGIYCDRSIEVDRKERPQMFRNTLTWPVLGEFQTCDSKMMSNRCDFKKTLPKSTPENIGAMLWLQSEFEKVYQELVDSDGKYNALAVPLSPCWFGDGILTETVQQAAFNVFDRNKDGFEIYFYNS